MVTDYSGLGDIHSAVICWYGGLPGAPDPCVRRVPHTRIGLAAPNGSPLVLVYTTALWVMLLSFVRTNLVFIRNKIPYFLACDFNFNYRS